MRIENSFVPVRGVGEKTERRLWREGITHWDDFEPSSVGDVQGDNIIDYIDRARDRLAAGDTAFFDRAFPSGSRWRLYENFRANACFFDIETTGLDARHNDVTTVSFHRAGETTTLVRGEDLTREAVRRELDAADLLVSFNGKRFDVPFLERSFDLDIAQPHLDVMYPCRQLDLTGGLKAIEEEIGIERDRPDISGRDAVRLWHAYERGDEDALDTLVSYNRADTVNLKSLLDTVTRRLHESVFVSDTEQR
ncbi:ribonuclease H-like domain-containing protein [Halococcus dombrowskii]|uniref:Ribonuclease H-like domain-containing protein n=1 Tax=Halococcus dombrowskii TaxID=179637 RepID=A0AAV3SHK8_HALDO|nr:ribonuclease H-like domain-containing protein [Halococcus dombrowskii]UOO94739.1 ribonuclease H-like domain-containing protein [Halococcus dombrowskii]